MNKNILKTGVQDFIAKNLNTDIVSVLLKKPVFEGISQQELAQQIESKKKCQKKLPTWFNTPNIFYPKKIHIEQTSSEITAAYKSKIVDGKLLLDITGGFGIDSYYFSKKTQEVFYCEINKELHEITTHNFDILQVKNIQTLAQNGLDFLKNSNQNFDWIYLDPSRRNTLKEKVVKLEDYTPDVTKNLELFFNKSENILLKTSPLLDLSIGIETLKFVKEIHIIAVGNDVKELLWVLKKGYLGEVNLKTVNHNKAKIERFDFSPNEEKKAISVLSPPLTYLYEPNAAILKSGAFKHIGASLGLKKLNPNTHLYTSERRIDFPGRIFQIDQVIPYHKKSLKSLNIEKANITTRNFPETVVSIRKKFKIIEGGTIFLFCYKNCLNELQVVMSSKIS